MSTNFVLDRRSNLKLIGLGLVTLFALAGCAKFPTNITPDSTRVIFRMTVRGEIRSDYTYIIAIKPSVDSNPQTVGPIPVTQFPSANGFVAGDVEYYVKWTPDAQQYTLYHFDDTSLTFSTAIGVPINTVDVTQGSRTIGFELTVDQLITTPTVPNPLQALQVNFLTMNKILDQGNGGGRLIDCLGNTNTINELNSPVKIPLATSGTYDNARFNFLEPTDPDVLDPDLDIVDWSIEVRRQ